MMFEPFAQDIAERLGGIRSGHILEIAAGTGPVIRAFARALPSEVAITATDLKQLQAGGEHDGHNALRAGLVAGGYRPTSPRRLRRPDSASADGRSARNTYGGNRGRARKGRIIPFETANRARWR